MPHRHPARSDLRPVDQRLRVVAIGRVALDQTDLVTGSILAFAAGWNIVIVAEFINYGGLQLSLPGLGSMLDRATQRNPPDTTLFLVSLGAMITLIIFANRVLWNPLMIRSERYKFD